MRRVGIRLVRVDGRPLDAPTVLVNAVAPGLVHGALVRVARGPLGRGRAVALSWLIRAALALSDPERRTLGDRVAGTLVVQV